MLVDWNKMNGPPADELLDDITLTVNRGPESLPDPDVPVGEMSLRELMMNLEQCTNHHEIALYEHAVELYLEHEHFCSHVEQLLEQLCIEIRHRYSVVANEIKKNTIEWTPENKQTRVK